MTSSITKIRNGAYALIAIVSVAVLAFRYLAGYSWTEAIWIVVITISTVGYGEHSNVPTSIQWISIGLILFGVSAAAYTTTGLVQLALEGEFEKAFGRRRMVAEISKLKDHVIICGFGKLGSDLSAQLSSRQQAFVAIDVDPAKFSDHNETHLLAVIGDATDEDVLHEANLTQAKTVVTALPTDAENVFIALTARNLCSDIQIISVADRESSCKKLRQAGANKIVMPHHVGAQQMERMISRPTTADLAELFAESSRLEMEFDECVIGNQSDLAGKSLAESQLKDEYNLLVVGIKKANGEFKFNPNPNHRFDVQDIVLLIGDRIDIDRMKTKHS